MTSLKKILVGFDFSERANQALQRARELAKTWGAGIKVLHVIQELPYEGASQQAGLVDMMGRLEKEVSEELEKRVQEIVRDEVEVDIQVQTGVPNRELLLSAQEDEVDLILLGSRGDSDDEERDIGRNCEAILHHSMVPVWVEEGSRHPSLGTILIPTDLSEHSRGALLESLEWARKFNAKILILHAVEAPFVPSFSMINPNEYEETLAKLGKGQFEEFVANLPAEGIEVETIFTIGDPAGETESYAKEKDVDLIALSTHGKTGLASKLLGSVAIKILRRSPCPVLVARPPSLDFSWLKKAFQQNS